MIKSLRAPVFILVVSLVTSCAPLSLYYKPGVEVSRMQSDSLTCETLALKDAPVANEIRQSPPIFYPGGEFCNGTNCYYRPGYWVEGNIYTVDVNRGLRHRIENQCMTDKGYQQVELEICNPSVAKAAGNAQTIRMPQLSEKSCAVRHENGSFLIVDPR
ncbi:hypothetical protein FEE96_10970 [Parasedimentitalea maritima]|uniref:Lipoprotein n=2 Tax=Parasedimentitalea maritima TaxID=2578117 RepID=A0ABY2UUD3_9RHOB|nr:hypothetical protein FEE96_10970 [Zongyanglinia marina]